MRHQVFGKKLGRDTNARKALRNNLAGALFSIGKVNTTLAKAKFAKPYIEKLITSASGNRLSTNRMIASHLPKDSLRRLLQEVGPAFLDKKGGYTRIVKIGRRIGDGAPMARLELLAFDKKPITESTEKNKKAQKEQTAKASSAPSKSSAPSVIKKLSDHPRKSAIDQRESA